MPHPGPKADVRQRGLDNRWKGHVKGSLTPYSTGLFRRVAPHLAAGYTLHTAGKLNDISYQQVQYLVRAARTDLGVDKTPSIRWVAETWLEMDSGR